MRQMLLVLITLNSFAYAQDERLSISVHVGPSVSDWIYFGNDTHPMITYNGGIEIRKRMGEKGWFFQSGLRLNEFGFGDLIIGYPYSSPDYLTVVRHDYQSTMVFVSLPLIFTYKFNKSANGLTLSLGPQLSYFVFERSKVDAETNFHTYDATYYWVASSYFSVGYERAINDKWILGGEAYSNLLIGPDPFYNYGLSVSGRYILK